MINNLVQAYCTGHDDYPASIADAYSLAAAIIQGTPGARHCLTNSFVQGNGAGCGDANGGSGSGGNCSSGGANSGVEHGGAHPYRIRPNRKNRRWKCGSAQHFEVQYANEPDDCGEEDAELSHNLIADIIAL